MPCDAQHIYFFVMVKMLSIILTKDMSVSFRGHLVQIFLKCYSLSATSPTIDFAPLSIVYDMLALAKHRYLGLLLKCAKQITFSNM